MRIQRTSGAPTASGTQIFIGLDLTPEESIPLRGKNATLAIDVSPGSGGAISLPTIGIYTSNGSSSKVLSSLASGWNAPAIITAPIITAGSGYYRFLVNPSAYTGATSLGDTFSQVSVLAQINMTATGASDYINISRIGLVEGNFDDFDNPDSIEVQQKAQQFCYVMQGGMSGRTVAVGQVIGSSQALVYVPFPSTMRTIPSVTVTASNFYITTATAIAVTCSSVTLSAGNGSINGANLTVVPVSASFTPGDATFITTSVSSTATLIFSADI
jgi:hypothetical protein